MGKKAKQLKVEALVEHLEPISDIHAVDIGLRRTDAVTNYIVGRFIGATNKRLIIKPYSGSEDHSIYVELNKNKIDTLEVKVVRQYSCIGFTDDRCKIKEKYDRSILFGSENVKIVGRFLKTLTSSMSERKLKLSTTPGKVKPDSFVISAVSACAIIGGVVKSVKKKVKNIVVRRKKEFFFKEKVNDESN